MPGYRAYCHAELAVFFSGNGQTPVLITPTDGRMARLSWLGVWLDRDKFLWPGVEPWHSHPSKYAVTIKPHHHTDETSKTSFTARSSYASAVLGIVILSVCSSVRPSHACLWRNYRTYCRYFDITWKSTHSSFLTLTEVGGWCPLLPEICT